LFAKVKGGSPGNASDYAGEDLAELAQSDLSDNLSLDDIKGFRRVGFGLLEHLREARESGNPDLIGKAEKDIHLYRSHLSNNYGIMAKVSKDEEKIHFRKYHRPTREIEKLRQLVKNQVNNAIKDFDRMPGFQSHLHHSLHIGSHKTVYSPENPTAWTVTT
jgi:hypothetical protein